MTFRKIPILFTAFFILFSACIFSDCYADYECGFDTNSCPYMLPPCYKIVVSGVLKPGGDPWDCEEEPLDAGVDGEKMLAYGGDCQWMGDNGEQLYYLGADPDHFYYEGGTCYGVYAEGGGWPTGSGVNNSPCDWDGSELPCYFGGGATWEPIWDCSACDDCNDNLIIEVSPANDPNMCYDDKTCCSNGPHTYIFEFTCDEADFVVPSDYDASNDAVIESFTKEPNSCSSGNSVKYTIKTKPANPDHIKDKPVTITMKASFFTIDNRTNSRSITRKIKCACLKCCTSKKCRKADVSG